MLVPVPAIKAKSKDVVHIQTGRISKDESGEEVGWHFVRIRNDPSRAKADCGFVGEVIEVDFGVDKRRICGRCIVQHIRQSQPDRA